MREFDINKPYEKKEIDNIIEKRSRINIFVLISYFILAVFFSLILFQKISEFYYLLLFPSSIFTVFIYIKNIKLDTSEYNNYENLINLSYDFEIKNYLKYISKSRNLTYFEFENLKKFKKNKEKLLEEKKYKRIIS